MIVMNGHPLTMIRAGVVMALWWASAEHRWEEVGWVAVRWERAGSESVLPVVRSAEAALGQGTALQAAGLVLTLAVQSVQRWMLPQA